MLSLKCQLFVSWPTYTDIHFLFPDMETKLAMMYILVSVVHFTSMMIETISYGWYIGFLEIFCNLLFFKICFLVD